MKSWGIAVSFAGMLVSCGDPDTDGTTTTSTTSSTSSAACYAMPDFLSCGQCVCNVNASGCDALYAIQDETLICGQRCGPTSPSMGCAPYCATVAEGMRDPERLDAGCEACLDTLVDGDADVEAFTAACGQDNGCTKALSALAMCPET